MNNQIDNLISLIQGYMDQGGQHINVNVMSKELLIDAQDNPKKYPQLTIRVSGYAVIFNNLTKHLQDEIISRTFHERVH